MSPEKVLKDPHLWDSSLMGRRDIARIIYRIMTTYLMRQPISMPAGKGNRMFRYIETLSQLVIGSESDVIIVSGKTLDPPSIHFLTKLVCRKISTDPDDSFLIKYNLLTAIDKMTGATPDSIDDAQSYEDDIRSIC